jgi:hypothetical protein
MSKRIVEAMLPGLEGKVYKASLHEGMNIFYICMIYCILHIFRILVITTFCIIEQDGDQLVDFYWIDPLMNAERIVAKSKYAGKLYLQFEPEESWERPGVRAFGRVNGGLIFEAAYLIDRTSVPLLTVFYSDKSHLKGTSHWPIYRKKIQTYCAYFTYSTYFAYC